MKTNTFIFIIALAAIIANCEQTTVSKQIPVWEKIFAIVGIVLIITAAVYYVNRQRNINVGQILRQYVVPSAQVTFVNFKNEHDPRVETIIQTSHTIDKSASFQEDNNYLSRDEELSIDQGDESQNRNLSSVFQKKYGTKNKKSKSRKRLANAAKVVNASIQQQNADINHQDQL